MCAAPLHFGKQFEDFFAECRGIFDGKFTVGVAQNTMCRWLLKIVFQDQAIGSHLYRVVGIRHGGIMHIQLEFDRHGSAIRQFDDIIRLADEGIGAG